MNDRLHEILAQCAVIHTKNIEEGNIFNLDKIEEQLESADSDIAEHYLSLLMQYYFQNNYLEGLQALLLQGISFELRISDVVAAFCHIKDDNESVIEFFEDQVVMLKDVVQEDDLKQMYEFYCEFDNKERLDEVVNFIKRNRYICAKAYKVNEEYAKFFINYDILKVLQEDLPFLLK